MMEIDNPMGGLLMGGMPSLDKATKKPVKKQKGLPTYAKAKRAIAKKVKRDAV